MSDRVNPLMLKLLAEWEETRACSQSPTPEEICVAHPEMLAEFRDRAERLASVDTLFDLAGFASRETKPDIPGFELEHLIGQGGMGAVYRGRDRVLNREVAVKLPVGAYCNAEARRRFLREGQTLARLRHPNIVPIHSAGVAGFTPYLVMDFIPGGHLGRHVKQPMSVEDVAAVMVQICRAVDHAHRAGIVHRDLKPSNILLDDAGRPLVCDFGVATLFVSDDEKTTNNRITSMQGCGTPAYAAPEQRRVDRERFAPSADVWSLGVVFCELLTSQRPVLKDSQNRFDLVLPELKRSQRNGGLEQIVRRCLAVSPSDRYPTAGAMADAIEGWQKSRKNRTWKIAAIALAVAMIAVAVSIAWFNPEAKQKRAVAAAISQLE